MSKFVRWPYIVSLLIAIGIVSQYQAIHDWIRLVNYDPPAAVVALADDITLTDKSRKLFYVNHPELQDRNTFNTSCSSRGEQTIVLGCYHPVDRGIFLFHVEDDRLMGVDQVTAAHEVLHAAYDRLSDSKQAEIDKLLQNFNDTGSYDERIKIIMASYQKYEPNDVVNEMHSIFATEVAGLPAELEQYYSQYFKDRSKIVRYATDYQTEFTSRQNQVAAYDVQLKEMKQAIDSNSQSIERQEVAIAGLRDQLDRDRGSDNVEAFNRNVPVYNARIDQYNALINRTKTLISDYNKTVTERNNLALQVTDLARSIDSSFQSIEQQ